MAWCSRRSATWAKLSPAPWPASRWPRRSPRQLRQRAGAAQGLRPDHRGHRASTGSRTQYKKIALFVSPTAVLASNTSGLGINKLADVLPEELSAPFLRRALLQPAALHALGRTIPAKTTDLRYSRGWRPSGHPARQGRGLRQGHPELHRQPHRRVLDPVGDPPRNAVRPRFRRGRCPDRPAAPAGRSRPPTAPRTWFAGHHGPRHQDHGRHPAR